MKVDQKIIDRFNELIKRGEKPPIKSNQFDLNTLDSEVVDSEFCAGFKVNGQNLISKVFGKDSEHYETFSIYTAPSILGYIHSIQSAVGILKAAKEDYEQGYLFNLQQRITADVFDDFLERAEYLLETGDYQAAAVVAGCVLEDALRKMCDRDPPITLSDKPKLDFMNGQLAKRGDYPSFIQKQITAIADIRNKAAHGDWDKFTKDDVKKIITDVRDFMAKYFA